MEQGIISIFSPFSIHCYKVMDEFITAFVPAVIQALSAFGAQYWASKINEKDADTHDIQYPELIEGNVSDFIQGLSSFLDKRYDIAAWDFYCSDINTRIWQINYAMGLGLSRACTDDISDETKIMYAEKAISLYNKLERASDLPKEKYPEILIRLGGIKKVRLFAKMQLNQLTDEFQNGIDEILGLLARGLQKAQSNKDVIWIEEAQYQLACVYAITNNETQTNRYASEIRNNEMLWNRLKKRIQERYNPSMTIEEELNES